MSNKPIRVVEIHSGETLGQFEADNWDGAHKLACEMEAMGIDIKIEAPSLPESLATSLGASESELEELRHEMDDEVDSHNNSDLGCMWCPPEGSPKQ